MFNPPHPGEILREEVIKPLDVGITEAARRWGMSRVALSRVLNERAGISAEMVVRLGRALDSDAELWLRMQAAYDLWQAERRLRATKVEPLKAE
jgi:addiction module HigA family antidote